MNASRATSSRRSPGVRRRLPAGNPASAGLIRSRRLRRKPASSCRSTHPVSAAPPAAARYRRSLAERFRPDQAGRMTLLLEDKVAFVSGAGRGIGAAAARLFAREGARVLLAARTADQLRAVTEDIRKHGGEADFVVCDLGDPASVRAAIDRVVSRYGRLDIAFNNGATIT